ncbi:hypothetical protein [Coleofasciculus sp. G2-EDA-02]
MLFQFNLAAVIAVVACSKWQKAKPVWVFGRYPLRSLPLPSRILVGNAHPTMYQGLPRFKNA